MEDKHREDPLIKDPGLKTNIKNDKLDETNESCERWYSLCIGRTYPLQAMSAPTAPDSRLVKPKTLADTEHGINLARKATTMIRNV
jgi:hypothetical protein